MNAQAECLRPVILGVVGDSASGKTTLTRGLVRVLGEENVAHISTDDYHRYDRQHRAELGITPLHPDCNYMDIMAQDLSHLRNGDPFLKPVYQHHDGTFGPLVRIDPKRFSVVEGLLGYYTEELRSRIDAREKGEELVEEEPAEPASDKVVDLMAALEESVAKAKAKGGRSSRSRAKKSA